MGETDKKYLKSLIETYISEDNKNKDYYYMVYNTLLDYVNKLDRDEMVKYINEYKNKNANSNKQFFHTYINNKVNYKSAVNRFVKNLKYYMTLRR